MNHAVRLMVFLASISACGGSGAGGEWTGAIDTTSSGIVHVVNGRQGTWGATPQWRLVEEMRIASADSGPASFSQITAISTDAAGRFYIAENRPAEIRVFNPDGRYLRTIGRPGSGPGEFRQVSAVLWDSTGRLVVVDQQAGRYSTFDSAGVFQSSIQRLVASNFSTYPWPGLLLQDGRFADVTLKPGSETFEFIVVVGRPELAARDTIELPRFEQAVYRHSTGDGRMQAGVPFSPSLVWQLDPRGHIWTATTDRYRIVQRGLGGDTVRVIELEYDPVPVTVAERDTAVAQLEWFSRQGGAIDASRIPGNKPAFGGLMVDDRGYLWTSPSRPEGATGTLFDVFDPSGRYLGRLDLDCRSWQRFVSADKLYAICNDEDGVPAVVRFRIEGRP